MPQQRRGTDTAAQGNAPKKRITGIIELTRKAVGYIAWPLDEARGKPDEREDIEVQPEKLGGALNGDEVEVELTGLGRAFGKKPARFQAKVVRVVSRAKTDFVATMKGGVAVPDDVKFYKPIRIVKGEAADGEKVLVHLLDFPSDGEPTGEIKERLGKAGEHRVEMNAIVLEHGFSTDFPEAVKKEAADIEKITPQ